MKVPGRVVLVGSGPGAPDLITLRGQEWLSRADAVVYDALVDASVLDCCKPDAERIFVGKRGGRPSWKQQRIQELLLRLAREGKNVVRLKGGDPLLFARGGEEAEFLNSHDVAVEIVPGVTAASGAAAESGFPLTHRGIASELAFVTGHEDPDKPVSGIDWQLLARWPGTLVFYMGRKNWPHICAQLVKEGMSPTAPVAAVLNATLPGQQKVKGRLGAPQEILENIQSDGPVLFFVGRVVEKDLLERAGQNLPLQGWRILITRTERLNSRLALRLRRLGASVISLPTLAIEPPDHPERLDEAIGRLNEAFAVVFTSRHGVDFFFARVEALGKDARALAGTRVVAIGAATQEKLAEKGIRADWVPKAGTSRAIAEEWPRDWPLPGRLVLLPRSNLADDSLVRTLRQNHGARVLQVTAYKTVPARMPKERIDRLIEQPPPDAIVFTSASTVRFFCASVPKSWFSTRSLIACIGPVTAREAERQGLRAQVLPQEPNIESMVQSLVVHFGGTVQQTGERE